MMLYNLVSWHVRYSDVSNFLPEYVMLFLVLLACCVCIFSSWAHHNAIAPCWMITVLLNWRKINLFFALQSALKHEDGEDFSEIPQLENLR